MARGGRPRAKTVHDLSNAGLESLADLPVYPDLEELIVDGNNLRSFAGLKVQPKLEVIRACNNPDLEYLNGLREQPALRELDLRGTKLESQPAFRVTVLATVGEKLMVLNGKALTRTEQELANTYADRKQFFLKPEEELDVDQEDDEELAVFNELHAKEHSEFFDAFAENEAVLWELKECGPLPFIDETSTAADLCAAIENIRNRIDKIRQKNQEFQPTG